MVNERQENEMITYISIVIIIGMIGFFENDFYIDFMIDGKY